MDRSGPPLRENISEVLVDGILSGEFPPGEHLNESDLSRRLGVSRAPIREALQHLLEQGLVVNQPRKGMFVVSLGEVEVQQINGLRLLLEAEALRLCRRNRNPRNERELTRQIERIESLGATSALEAMRLDLAFHRTIWLQSGNEFLDRTLFSLTRSIFADTVIKKTSQEKKRMVLDSHRHLLDYIVGRHPAEDAAAVIYRHISMRWGRADRFVTGVR